MALQVWLPLNKNYSNRGLDNGITATGNMAFATTGAPIACYNFTASQNITISGVDFSKLKTASISLWVWRNSSVNTVFFTGPSTSHYIIASSTNGTSDIYHSGNVGGTKKMYVDGVEGVKLGAAGAWHHYVIADVNLSAWTGTVLKFNNYSSTYNFAGRVRDIRIFDHVLTAQEVGDIYLNKVFEFTPQWIDKDRIMDASGFNFPLTPHNLTINGNEAKFNGSSTYVEFNGLHLSGGSVSIWANLPAKPTAQKIYYCDPTSKMVVGYLTGGTILTAANGVNKASYQNTGITWKQWHHIVAVWNSSYVPTALYVNGVQAATGTSSNWTNSGGIAAIGRRVGSGSADYLSGSVNEVKVFSSQLTAADVQELYAMGPCNNNWTEEKPDMWRNMYLEYSGCTWLKVLHHNAPARNLFTTANRKNNDDENLFSRLGLFDDTSMFKMTNGKYQFMVREKLESTSTENIGIWTQTSSPTANAIAGYTQIYSSTGSWPRSFGLTHQSANAVFDDSASSWWCACGCSTAYQGGIPGFWGNVKTGYLDLYIRVDDTQFLNNMG